MQVITQSGRLVPLSNPSLALQASMNRQDVVGINA